MADGGAGVSALAGAEAVTALAIFVKTPGLSPIKTRLAAGIGAAAAAAFYTLAVHAVAEIAAASSLVPYWAVAEADGPGHPLWSGFATVSQGEGELGARLACVYRNLQARHGSVLLIGADSPQTTPALLRDAAARCDPFVMGRAADGGFWLFGGNRPIPTSVWSAVPYSAPDTAERLLAQLNGDVAFVAAQHDVDEATDLDALQVALEALATPLAGQVALLHWLRAG